MASLADYAAAYALAGEVLAETLSDVKKPLREALRAHPRACPRRETDSVSRREIREALGVPDSTVRRLARRARGARVPGRAEALAGRRRQGDALPARRTAARGATSSLGLLTPRGAARSVGRAEKTREPRQKPAKRAVAGFFS